MQLATLFEEQALEALSHRVHAALHEPHAVQKLDHRDDHVQRRPFVGGDADVERLKRERLAQPVVLHVFGHRRVRVPERVQPSARHEALRIVEIERAAKRPLEEVVLRDEVAFVEQREVGKVALRVALAHGLDRLGDGREVVRQAQPLVRTERDVHERLDLLHGDVVVGIAPAHLEHLAVQRGHHHDGGADVEGEPVPADTAHLPANLRLLFVEGDLVAGVLQPYGRREAADAGPDDDYPFHATPSMRARYAFPSL